MQSVVWPLILSRLTISPGDASVTVIELPHAGSGERAMDVGKLKMSQKEYGMASNIVQLVSGKEVEVPGPVSQVVPDGNRCYVMLDSNPPEAVSDNVLCYDEHGTLLWRVEDLFPGQNSTFGSGHVRKDGRLEFWNTDGLWILMDKDTGKGLGFRWDRFGPCGESENDSFQPIHWRDQLRVYPEISG